MSKWYYAKEPGQKIGPISTCDLKKLALSEQIGPEDLVLKEGAAKWVMARKIKGLFDPSSNGSPGSSIIEPPPVRRADEAIADEAVAEEPYYLSDSGNEVGRAGQAVEKTGHLSRVALVIASGVLILPCVVCSGIGTVVGPSSNGPSSIGPSSAGPAKFDPNDLGSTSHYLAARLEEVHSLYKQNEMAGTKRQEDIQKELDRRVRERVRWKFKVNRVAPSFHEKMVVWVERPLPQIEVYCSPSEPGVPDGRLLIGEHVTEARAMKLRKGDVIQLQGQIQSISFGGAQDGPSVSVTLSGARVIE